MAPACFGLSLEDFATLGDFAPAGLRATQLVLGRAKQALCDGRIPISGAVVVRKSSGALLDVTVGQNGRIPPLDDEESAGYPTDHGETGALRLLQDAEAHDWPNAVFATSLSPCIMCFRSIEWLHSLGLRHVVVAESSSFPGTSERVAALSEMRLVRLAKKEAIAMMRRFARCYPWDWAADIGEIPALDTSLPGKLREGDMALRCLEELKSMGKEAAVLLPPGGRVAAAACDRRGEKGGNEVWSAALQAMGLAGSAVNLREAVLAVVAPPGAERLEMEAFGRVSLGACELFRPAALLVNVPVEQGLRALLQGAGVEVLSCGGAASSDVALTGGCPRIACASRS